MPSRSLIQIIDEILFYIWDPLGVSTDGAPEWRNEYETYTQKIAEMVKANADSNAIAAYLDKIESEYMQLTLVENRNNDIAQMIIDNYKYLADNR